MSERRHVRLLLVLTGLSLALALGQALTGLTADVLIGLPAVALLLPLVAGRYLGEDELDRFVTRLTPRPARRRRPVAVPLPRAPRRLPRGGRLVATAMGTRGPPALTPAR